ncbi:hypothetical protein M758_UG091300 [Ceratodon purpureus]|nr:hypothetical protein M758_UG091300 [Ceratodon purpureus]
MVHVIGYWSYKALTIYDFLDLPNISGTLCRRNNVPPMTVLHGLQRNVGRQEVLLREGNAQQGRV